MKKNKIFLIVGIVVVVILILILINKLLILNNFKSEVRNLNLENIFDETINVVNYNEIKSDEIFNYEELTMKNYFKEYKENVNNSSTYRSNAKPGSMMSKANMVKDFNEKNNR